MLNAVIKTADGGTLGSGRLSHPPPASCLEWRMTTTCCGGKLERMSALLRSFSTGFHRSLLIVGLSSWGYSADRLVSSSIESGILAIYLSSKPERRRTRHFASPGSFSQSRCFNVYRNGPKILERLTVCENRYTPSCTIFLLIYSRWHLLGQVAVAGNPLGKINQSVKCNLL